MNSDADRLEQVLHALQELQLSVEAMKTSLQTLVRANEDHEERLRAIERWQNQLTPVAALATFVGGVLFQLVMSRWAG